VLLADNVLWSGRVIDPGNEDDDTLAMRAFNDVVAADDRVDVVLLPAFDGLTVARRR
jgi:caffeoyl-CoA O-methyltransferase